MRREWKEEPDEIEEVSLEETQEYRVPGTFDEDSAAAVADFDEVDDEYYEVDEADELEDEEVLDEEMDDDYFEDDEDFFEETDETDETDLPEPVAGTKPAYEPLADRIKAVWAAVAAQARGTELPRFRMPGRSQGSPEADGTSDDRRASGAKRVPLDAGLLVPIVAILLLSLAVGIGTYAIGKGSGDDVDVARLEGEAAGKQAGAIEGASRGYAAGFKQGRDAGFEKAYVRNYRIHFKRAFEQAGLDVPSNDDFAVPEP